MTATDIPAFRSSGSTIVTYDLYEWAGFLALHGLRDIQG